MRILYPCWLDAATADLRLFLAREWTRVGHEVLLFPFDLVYSNFESTRFLDSLVRCHPAARFRRFQRAILKKCRSFRPDVVISGGTFLSEKVIRAIQRGSDCLVGQELAQNTVLVPGQASLVSVFDFLIVHDSYLMPLLHGSRYGRNPNVYWFGCMADPAEHRPVALSEYDQDRYGADVAFIGGISENRVEALRRLTRFRLKIWGAPEYAGVPDLAPFYSNEPVYGLKKTKIYNAAKIVLNVEDSEKQVNAISVRVPEVLACGGFVLTEWRQDLASLPLVEGESIAVYHSVDELRGLVGGFLNNPQQRETISRRGRRVVLGEMTYAHVAKDLSLSLENLLDARRTSRLGKRRRVRCGEVCCDKTERSLHEDSIHGGQAHRLQNCPSSPRTHRA